MVGVNKTETAEYLHEDLAFNVFEVFVIIAVLFGMFLNTTTIIALIHLPWSSKPNLRLVQSLCVANLAFAFNFLFYMVTFYTNPSESGYAGTCLFFEVVRCVLYIYIYLNVTSIVLDLYLAVTNPLGYASIVTTGRSNKLLVINAVISILIAGLSIMFNYLTLTEAPKVYVHESSCSLYPSYSFIRSLNWIFKVSIFISIPVFVVLLIIIFLAVKATKSSANNRQPSNIRGVVNVIIVVFVFLACFGPYQFISFYLQYSPDSYTNFSTIAKILERMFYLNGFFTPLLYSLRMTDVKKGYTLMFKKCVSAASDYQSVFTGN